MVSHYSELKPPPTALALPPSQGKQNSFSSRGPPGRASNKRTSLPALPFSHLCYSVGQTWSLCAPHLYTCLPLLCLFFKMLKTRNKKQIQNAVINSQFQANPASLLINLNTCKKNNKFCLSLVLRWSLLYPVRVCVCMWVSVSTYIFIFLYFPSREGQNNELRASGKMNLRY